MNNLDLHTTDDRNKININQVRQTKPLLLWFLNTNQQAHWKDTKANNDKYLSLNTTECHTKLHTYLQGYKRQFKRARRFNDIFTVTLRKNLVVNTVMINNKFLMADRKSLLWWVMLQSKVSISNISSLKLASLSWKVRQDSHNPF